MTNPKGPVLLMTYLFGILSIGEVTHG